MNLALNIHHYSNVKCYFIKHLIERAQNRELPSFASFACSPPSLLYTQKVCETSSAGSCIAANRGLNVLVVK